MIKIIFFIILLMSAICSCKTTSHDQKINIEDFSSSSRFTLIDDSTVSLSSLVSFRKDDVKWIVRDFDVVEDSSGNKVSVLSRETEISACSTQLRDSSNTYLSDNNIQSEGISHSYTNLYSHSQKESKPPDYRFISIVVVLVIVGFFVFYLRKLLTKF